MHSLANIDGAAMLISNCAAIRNAVLTQRHRFKSLFVGSFVIASLPLYRGIACLSGLELGIFDTVATTDRSTSAMALLAHAQDPKSGASASHGDGVNSETH